MSGIQSQTKKIFEVVALRGEKKKKASACVGSSSVELNTGEKLSSTPLSPSPPPEPKDAQRLHCCSCKARGITGSWQHRMDARPWGLLASFPVRSFHNGRNENAEPPEQKHQPPHMTGVEVGRSPRGLALAEPIMIEHGTIRASLSSATDFRKASKNNCGGPGSPSEWISWKEACLFRALQEDHSQSGVSKKS